MINPVKRSGLRLLERTKNSDKEIATTIINNRPYDNNFLPVRISLGISPIDSLLYAPITLILEGETEVSCLPILLEMCREKLVSGFEDLDQLWALSHIIDGQGDNLELWCRMAKSQGAHPIVFVDGDKIKWARQHIGEKHPDVPIRYIGEDQEFEDIVPRNTYFQALAECCNIESNVEIFDKWKEDIKPRQRMFSKQVNMWLAQTHGFSLNKPEVMKKAIEMADLNEVELQPFRELVSEMKILAKKITQG